MADNNGAVPEKMPIDDPEAVVGDHELDDSKAKFINGGMDDTKVMISGSDSNDSFVGLGKEELKKYAEDPFWVRTRWILFIMFWVGWLAMLVSAIVIIVLAPRCPTRPDLKWYNKDVAYNTYAKSFFDADKDDGYGDLEGIKAKKGYIDSLGANTIWLSSVLSTEMDNDRAVLDYKALDAKFGTVEALKAFCKRLVKDGKQVIMDLIPNQTSRNHTWFMESKKKAGKYADYYVWSDTNPGWTRADGTPMWENDATRGQYYLAQFAGTADLDLTNEDVIAEFKEIMQFWANQGINGFHLNDVEYLAENTTMPLPKDDAMKSQTRNFDANADVVNSFRSIADGMDNKPGREKLVFGTVTSTDASTLDLYKGGRKEKEGEAKTKGLHMVGVVLDQLTRSITAAQLQAALDPFVSGNDTAWLGWRLTTSTPGSRRLNSRIGDDRMIIAHALQALLPGSSMPYYGDEIGMSSGTTRGRETVTPMQWSKDDNAGFTKGKKPWIPVNSNYMTKNLNSLTAQLGDNLLVDSFKALNTLRTKESLQFGKTRLCSVDDLLIFSRDAPGFPSFVVVANMGATTSHSFRGDECVGDRDSATIAFISHNADHAGTTLDLGKAIAIAQNEVLVLEFPA